MNNEPMAWATSEAERVEIEQRLQALVGRRIERVRYAELDYFTPSEPGWTGPVFDSIDYGLELDVDDGETWSIAWEQAGHNQGIVVFAGRHQNLQPESAGVVWDVTDHWIERGPTDIAAVTPIWGRSTWAPIDRRGRIGEMNTSALCLFAFILSAAEGRDAVFGLGQRDDDGGLMVSHDNIVVFFSVADARAAGLSLESESGFAELS